MCKETSKNNIPEYVSGWTDKYFHQSAFNIHIRFPNKKVVNYLSKYKKKCGVKLLRGVNDYNKENYTGIHSWTYDKKVASRYAKESGGKIIENFFSYKKILLDTTVLNQQEKIFLGYDYKIDDKEVLVLI